jgi:hypothetical protein
VITAGLQGELFEVTSEDNDGNPISDERRFRAFLAALQGEREIKSLAKTAIGFKRGASIVVDMDTSIVQPV